MKDYKMSQPCGTYELLDSGNFKRLEQVGPYRIARPAPSAVWPAKLNQKAWQDVDAEYFRYSHGQGQWKKKTSIPDRWIIEWQGLHLIVKLTSFGHLGLFAEHSTLWPELQKHLLPRQRILNLFAYTGATTLMAAQRGAEVTHVDASKTALELAKLNAQQNQLEARWIMDDVVQFVQKEVRRGCKYDGIVLDPPSYGRGPKKQIWKIEESLPPLLSELKKLCSDEFAFILLTAHTPGYGPQSLLNLLRGVLQYQ